MRHQTVEIQRYGGDEGARRSEAWGLASVAAVPCPQLYIMLLELTFPLGCAAGTHAVPRHVAPASGWRAGDGCQLCRLSSHAEADAGVLCMLWSAVRLQGIVLCKPVVVLLPCTQRQVNVPLVARCGVQGPNLQLQ